MTSRLENLNMMKDIHAELEAELESILKSRMDNINEYSRSQDEFQEWFSKMYEELLPLSERICELDACIKMELIDMREM